MLTQGFPATADPYIALLLYEESKKVQDNVHMGINLTSGAFYETKSVM